MSVICHMYSNSLCIVRLSYMLFGLPDGLMLLCGLTLTLSVYYGSLCCLCVLMTDIMDIDIDMSIFFYFRLFIYLRIFRYWKIFEYWSGYSNIGYFTYCYAVLPYGVCVPDCQHHSLHLYCRYV